MKTIKTITKRFRKTKSGKYLKIQAGRDHFNARESGNTTRGKRRLSSAHHANAQVLKKYIH